MKTYHDGAKDERKAWMAKIKRELKADKNLTLRQILILLDNFGSARIRRYGRVKGGL